MTVYAQCPYCRLVVPTLDDRCVLCGTSGLPPLPPPEERRLPSLPPRPAPPEPPQPKPHQEDISWTRMLTRTLWGERKGW